MRAHHIFAEEIVLAWLAMVMKTIVSYFFDAMASTVSATLRADSCVSAVA